MIKAAIIVIGICMTAILLLSCKQELDCPGHGAVATVLESQSESVYGRFGAYTITYVKLLRTDGTVCVRRTSMSAASMLKVGDKVNSTSL
jgi:hypothetical protein